MTRPDRRTGAFSRRRSLAALAAALMAPGCAAWVHAGRDPGAVYRSGRAPKIGVLIFEATGYNFPFHTAAVIDAPEGRMLYDPGGWWDDGAGQRVGDVTHGLTPAREAAYERRDYFGAAPGDWRLHRFDRRLDAAEASRAATLAQDMPPVVFGLCCWALTSVLSQLPSFADVRVWVLPETLLDHLRQRDDLTYRSRLVP